MFKSFIRCSFIIFLLVACGPLQRNSPFSEQTIENFTDLNSHFINILEARDQTVQDIELAVLSDSHQNYDDLEEAISGINGKHPDFVAHLGDFTNQGYNIEWDLYTKRMDDLSAPHVQVIGNHDTLAKGKGLYQRIFGDYNRAFVYRGYKFILFNNCNLDFHSSGGTDWAWLRRQVQGEILPIVILQHINVNNKDYFSDDDIATYYSIVVGSTVRLVLHGHQHEFYEQEVNGVWQWQTSRTEGAYWSRIILKANDIDIEKCEKGSCKHATTKNFP